MNPKLYQERRDELLVLLEETLTLGLPEPHDSQLRNIRRKCQEDQFKIALVGEFQGGKSTTFNALCDGREISPRGLGGGGLKTSAAIVTAQHISRPEEEREGLQEWAEIRWRGDRDIVLGLADLLKHHLAEDAEFQSLFDKRPEEERVLHHSVPDAVADLVNPGDAGHRAALERALRAEWGRWNKDKTAYDAEALDQLRIVTLQLRFHDTSKWRELTSREVFSIAEFQKMIAFPRDWAQRWGAGIDAAFRLEEAAFVFIADVVVRLRAANLARVGCRITDCPGLFASAWDTKLAREAMSRADGLWYLFTGAKQIGESDMRGVRFILDNGWIGKLRVTVNLRDKTHEQIEEDIIPVDLGILKNMGMEMVDLKPYDARLAFLACQGNLLLHNPDVFGDYDRRCMGFDFDRKMPAEKLDPAVAWRRFVRNKASAAGLAQLEDVSALDDESVQAAREASRLDLILNELEGLVISQKARSILLDNGSHAAVAALERYEGDLKAKEDAALRTAEEFRKKAQESRDILEKFVHDAEALVNDSVLNEEAVDRELASEFTSAIIDKQLCDQIAESSLDDIWKLNNTFYWTTGKIKEAIKEALHRRTVDAYKSKRMATIESWRRGNGPVFNRVIVSKCERLAKRMHERWGEMSGGKELLKGVSLPDIPDAAFFGDQLAELSRGVAGTAGDVFYKMFHGPFGSLLMFIAIGHDLLIFGPIIGIREGIEAISRLFSSEEDKIRQLEKEKERIKEVLRRNRDKMKREISESCEKGLCDDARIREKTIEGHRFYFRQFREKCKDHFEAGLKRIKDEFEDRVKKAEATFEMKNAERAGIAAEAHHIRIEKIEPARMRIAAFEAKVKLDLGLSAVQS